MFFDIGLMRDHFGWTDAAYNFAQQCIQRLEGGEDPHLLQYSIVRGRAQGQSWAYGDTLAVVSRYGSSEPAVKLGQ